METNSEYIKKLVRERISAMPPDVSFSIGNFGDYTRNELLEEVDKDSEVGRAAIEMQLTFIRKMSGILHTQ